MNVFEADPTEIAAEVFSHIPPEKEIKFQLIPENEEVDSLLDCYQILITILFEGMDIFTDGLNTVESNDFSPEHFTALNPWMYTCGIKVLTDIVDKNNEEEYKDYYCKCIIKDSSYETFFEMKSIIPNYHFFLNPKYINSEASFHNLEDVYGVFFAGKKVIKIKFITHNEFENYSESSSSDTDSSDSDSSSIEENEEYETDDDDDDDDGHVIRSGLVGNMQI